MLTVAYCRVSTEEQAAEGFSIEGQAERLRAYAEFHELGEVTVITDPGLSGKNLDRPGLQRVMAMVHEGHVAHVLVWRLDRLSRDLGDLLLLADTFGKADVALHSFSEKIDLSSATGRMFYSVLGAFAQFYREQLAENVRMGMQQAVREGKWINRPKTGFDLIDGNLVPNHTAPIVRRIFQLRGNGASQGDIERATGVKYSLVRQILHSRIYLGEVLLNGEWYPGKHEPIITAEEFAAAHRGRVKGRRRGRDLLSGRVRCGLCGKRMHVEDNGSGHIHYRCRSRGKGCALPRRSTHGLHRAAVLGLQLLGADEQLREAIRKELAADERRPRQGRSSTAVAPSVTLAALLEERRKLLRLHYADQIAAEQFAEEQARLTAQIDTMREADDEDAAEEQQAAVVAEHFEAIAAYLAETDVDTLWEAATESERRAVIDEMLDAIDVYDDHLEVTVKGAPKLNVTLAEVGLGRQGEDWSCRRTVRNAQYTTCTTAAMVRDLQTLGSLRIHGESATSSIQAAMASPWR